MRSRIALLATLIIVGLGIATPAEAHWRRHSGVDPYAYSYEPRGYYPYYNSDYWRPAAELRYRRACCKPVLVLPPYYQAWGYPKPYSMHRAWYVRHRHHW